MLSMVQGIDEDLLRRRMASRSHRHQYESNHRFLLRVQVEFLRLVDPDTVNHY